MSVPNTHSTTEEPVDDQDPVDPADNVGDDDAVVNPPVAATPAATMVDDEEFGALTPREKSLIQKARSQEKTKLYGQLEELRTRLRTVETRPAPTAPTSGNGNTAGRQTRADEIQELRNSIQTLTTTLSEKERRDDERERRKELMEYRRGLLADRRARNVAFIDAMVVGDSEAALDAAMQASEAEAEYQRQNFARDYGIDTTAPRGATRPSRTTVVVQRDAPARPDNVPATVAPGVSGTSSEYLTTAQLNALTDISAIRNGTYAANRELVQRMVREGRIRD